MTRVLEVHDLEKNFGGVVAAHNINVTVDIGETIGIIGANGAGKTTFVNMVTGYLKPSGGRIEFMGKSVVGSAAARCNQARSLPVVPGAAGFSVGIDFRQHAGGLRDRRTLQARPVCTASHG